MTTANRGPFKPERRKSDHEHLPRELHALTRRHGIPYETERIVCSVCGRVLEEQTVRRADA